jgi:hypothetical protein
VGAGTGVFGIAVTSEGGGWARGASFRVNDHHAIRVAVAMMTNAMATRRKERLLVIVRGSVDFGVGFM